MALYTDDKQSAVEYFTQALGPVTEELIENESSGPDRRRMNVNTR
jgi:hypothetical protein